MSAIYMIGAALVLGALVGCKWQALLDALTAEQAERAGRNKSEQKIVEKKLDKATATC